MISHATRDIDLKLSQYDLYPPLLASAPAAVVISTSQPPGEHLDFDFTVDGEVVEVAGIRLQAGSSGGVLLLDRAFIAQYGGVWPVVVQISAYRDGLKLDSATLMLHDTRVLQVHRSEVSLMPNPASIPVEEDLLVQVRPLFFDIDGVQLPGAEMFWEVLLPGSAQGVTVEGGNLRITSLAQVGEVAVSVRERSGVESRVDLTLEPPQDIGLGLWPSNLYPPLNSSFAGVIEVRAEQSLEGVSFSATLNGQGGPHPGFSVISIGGSWLLYIEQHFIGSYQGSWPIEVKVRATRNQQLVGIASGWLHDTRQMVCTRVDLEFTPADTVQIPSSGELLVIAAPRFYDENDIRLPHNELQWDAKILDPMPGVITVKHLLYIGPDARPGAYRIAILGPEGLNRAKVLTLV